MVRPWRILRLAILSFTITIGATSAKAELYLVNITGGVDLVDPALAGTFTVGQSLAGSYLFESTTPPVAGSTSTFAVYNALKSLSFSVGSYSASTTGAPEIQVDNNPPSPNSDRYGVVARASDGLAGAAVGGNALTAFGFRLDDSTNTVFSTALVLPTNLSLSSFDSNRFFLFFGDFANPKLVSGTLSGMTFTAVPEPGSLVLSLVGLGVLGAGHAVRRRWS